LLLLQVQGSGALGGGLGLSQVAVSTVLDSVFDTNSADTGGGGLDATGYSDSSLLVQGCRYASDHSKVFCKSLSSAACSNVLTGCSVSPCYLIDAKLTLSALAL
jgi:hypothetical protein